MSNFCVSDLKDTLEKERSERVEVGASLVERDREVHRLLAEIERRDIQHDSRLGRHEKKHGREKDVPYYQSEGYCCYR